MANSSQALAFIGFLLTSRIPGILSQNNNNNPHNLRLLSQWKELEFEFPTPELRQYAISNGQYVRGNSVPIDVDVDYSGIIYILYFNL